MTSLEQRWSLVIGTSQYDNKFSSPCAKRIRQWWTVYQTWTRPNTNAHLKCSPRLQTNPWLCGTWYSAVFKVEQLRTLFVSKNIWSRVAMLISRSWNSVCIFLNTNVFYVLLNVYAFGLFLCFGLIGFPFYMRSILRSIYADYRSLLFDKPPSQSFLGLCNALLREGTHEEALRTSLWTTFCLVQFSEGRHRNYQQTKLLIRGFH